MFKVQTDKPQIEKKSQVSYQIKELHTKYIELSNWKKIKRERERERERERGQLKSLKNLHIC
jgi:hypothetical protein